MKKKEEERKTKAPYHLMSKQTCAHSNVHNDCHQCQHAPHPDDYPHRLVGRIKFYLRHILSLYRALYLLHHYTASEIQSVSAWLWNVGKTCNPEKKARVLTTIIERVCAFVKEGQPDTHNLNKPKVEAKEFGPLCSRFQL